jgi:hypothetical protein
MAIPPEQQHALFIEAATLLGGQRSAARAMNVSERTMGRLLAGQAALHDGFLRDMAGALRTHAEACRALERRIAPELPSNRAPDQPAEDARRTGARWQGER